MTRTPLGALCIAFLVTLGLVVPLLAVTAAPVAADHAANQSAGDYRVEQGDRCLDVAVIGDGTTNASTFYDYRPSENYSSHGTTDLQRSQVSQLFVYDGAEGTSLVFLHDAVAWDEQGGAVTMSISGLPASGRWLVEDDSYGNGTDDNFDHGTTTSEIDWMWGPGRTDGGVFRGLEHLGHDEAIVVDPAFGEESYAHTDRPSRWPYATNDTAWRVRTGEDELTSIDEDQPITVAPYACAPGATLSANTTAPGLDGAVAFTADSTFAGGEPDAYEWDVDGDGTVETVGDATLTHSYDARGTYEATVTAVYDDAEDATATVTVTVADETPPTALASANRTTVAVGDPVAFDGADSTDNVGVAGATWAFGDGTTAEGANVTHSYDAPGTYDATLTVTDEAGNENATVVPVTVESNAPDAAVTAPASAAAGETVTFDASNSSDPDGIAEYRWDVGDDGTYENTTTSPTLDWEFEAAGDHPVTVTVVDATGRTSNATAAVTVTAGGPTARASANRTTVAPGAAVSFDASNSSDGQAVAGYDWSFDDGTSATGAQVTHSYDAPGTYDATLTVTGDDGNTDTDAVTVVVDGTPPTAALDVNRTTTEAGAPVAFDGTGSSDDGSVASHSWDFGDGAAATGGAVTHAYGAAGTYEVTLTVRDAAGNANETTTTIEVDPADGDEDDGDDGDGGEGDDGDDDDSGNDGGNDGDDGDDGSSGDDGDDSDDGGSGNSGNSGSSGSSGGSGGGGGGALPPVTDDGPTADATAERRADGRVAVTVRNASAGTPVSVRVPDDSATGPSVRTLVVTPERDADRLNVTLRTEREVPTPAGTDAAMLGASVTNESAFESVAYEFAVSRPASDARFRTLRENGTSWDTVDHSVATNGSTALVNVTATDARRHVLATRGPQLTVRSLSVPDQPVVDEPVTVTATVANDGHRAANRSVPVTVDGEAVASRTVTVPVDGTATVSYDLRFDSPGDRRVAVLDQSAAVQVLVPGAAVELVDVDASPSELQSGGAIEFRATFENRGVESGSTRFNATLAGAPFARDQVSLGPGETRTLTFDESIDAPGTYEFSVDGAQIDAQQATVRVVDGAARNTTADPATGDGSPGGGDQTPVLVAGFGLLIVTAAALTRYV